MDENIEDGSFMWFWLYAVIAMAALYLARKFFKGGQFTENVSAKDKVAVVTGANAGIGLETVRGLNLVKAKVYMLCRNEERAKEAIRKLVKMGCDVTRLIFVQCDLCNFSSIRKAAGLLLKKEKSIDILINNAGIMFYPKYEKTGDGHEMTWQSNYLGPFLLTELLLPALKASPAARIVNVSSKLHLKCSKIDLSIVDDKKGYGLLAPNNRAKLAKVMHVRELTRRMKEEGTHNVTANSLHPGFVNTELSRHLFCSRPPFTYIAAPFQWFFLKTPRDGAQTSLYLALSKKVDGISGKYFSDCNISSENPVALDEHACEDLYNYSLEQIN